jgi:hypothetical protein
VQKSDLAYAAGIMDGEGSFTVSYSPRWKSFIGDIGFAMTKPEIVYLFQQWFGGAVSYSVPKNPKHSDVYRWRIHSIEKRRKFILAILPYLRLKREQALLFLKFVDLPPNWAKDDRMKIVEEIQKLNKRGKSVTTNMLDSTLEKRESDLIGDDERALHGDMIEP